MALVGALPVPHLSAGVPRIERIDATVRSVHNAPVRCGFRSGSAADGHGAPASFSAQAIRAWFNGTRLHSSLGYRSPADYEADHHENDRLVA